MDKVILIVFIQSLTLNKISVWTEIFAQHFENVAGGISLQQKIFLPSGNILL